MRAGALPYDQKQKYIDEVWLVSSAFLSRCLGVGDSSGDIFARLQAAREHLQPRGGSESPWTFWTNKEQVQDALAYVKSSVDAARKQETEMDGGQLGTDPESSSSDSWSPDSGDGEG